MKYLKKTYKAGNTIEVQKTYSAVWGRSLTKAGKTGKSRLSVQQYNDRVAVRIASVYALSHWVDETTIRNYLTK